MIAAQKTIPRTLPDWLRQIGWKESDRLQSLFTFHTPEGDALLKCLPGSSQSAWTVWSLQSPHVPTPDPDQIFAKNRELQGPWKFVADIEGQIRCRADVPRDVFVTDDSFDLATGQTWAPLQCWTEATTLLASGGSPTFEHAKPTPTSLVDWLKEKGFVASSDQESVRVTVPLSGTFREIAVNWQDGGLVHLSADLGRLSDWPEASRQAGMDFLQEANRRLRLVRIVEREDRLAFSMEASFCAPGPGVWLQSALDALCTGMALVVTPLASLRDSGVADMFLAGTTANRKGGVS